MARTLAARKFAVVTDPSPAPEPRPPRTLLRRADQACAGAIVGLSLLVMAAYWITQGGHRGGLIEIDRAEPLIIDFKLDINAAGEAELSLLPGIGPIMARKIIDSREADGPFFALDDLQRIKGIGPKTVDRIRPYLLPVPDREHVAGP